MTAAEWLARARAVTDGATPEPWVSHEPHGPMSMADVRKAGPWGPEQGVAYRVGRQADATFIAASRTLLPAAVAAIEAVLALHEPVWADTRGGYHCAECSADLTDATPDCPTVRAITAALDGLS